MKLSVTGKQIDIGQALRQHVEDGLQTSIAKYFSDAIDARVVVSRDGKLYHTEISVHIGKGIVVHAQASSGDIYGAFDTAANHMAKRLRRYKRRLRDHHRNARQSENIAAQQFIISADEGADDSANEPVIVAEMEAEIASLTVSEAVMRMDLANQSALMFRNRAHGGLNMLYRRPDGNIGWVDPRGNRETG
ncbi:MAG: ribosome hibernation-promoting factor, HPF/YfiA family [Alphaproteobacteria bacterium]